MWTNKTMKELGENKIIEMIENLIYKRTKKEMIRDDAFFFSFMEKLGSKNNKYQLIFNSDMLVSTTDIPKEMSFYQMGRKAVLMNVSDLIVKGVNPLGIFISLGLPLDLKYKDFEDMITGIIDYCITLNIEYIGGDINETKEIIINPSVFGILEDNKIIKRRGLSENDLVVINGKFGLTGVGFDILLKKKEPINNFERYQRSIRSILEPKDLGGEGIILSNNQLATASIDSSDGLGKSLNELIHSNSEFGFEIEFNDNLIDSEAIQFSKEFMISLENLVFSGGEEFIHIFTIKVEDFHEAKKAVQTKGGNLYKIGKVISDPKIYLIKNNERIILNIDGFNHFNNK